LRELHDRIETAGIERWGMHHIDFHLRLDQLAQRPCLATGATEEAQQGHRGIIAAAARRDGAEAAAVVESHLSLTRATIARHLEEVA
jgi:DNA-binding GntR family transcriptional regulator